MTGKRWASLLLLLASLGVSMSLGTGLWMSAKRGRFLDFQYVYYSTLCLMQHRDPYDSAILKQTYAAQAAGHPAGFIDRPENVGASVYPPTAFVMIAPLAALPWNLASLVWLAILAVSLYVAAWLMSSAVGGLPSGGVLFLVCFLLANSEILFGGGNAAGVAVSLCLIAVWCFLEDRSIKLGIVCLAVSLALKPHDAGFVWLYFALAGGRYRRRALQCLGVCAVIGLAAIVWTSNTVPNWSTEWQNDLRASLTPGTGNDPGSGTAGVLVNLQTVIAVFRNDPRFYNYMTYAVCGSLLAVWAIAAFRWGASSHNIWFGLAAVAPLTLLVTYHRPYDAKLLLLTIPAFATLSSGGGLLARVAFAITSLGIFLTSDIPIATLDAIGQRFRIQSAGLGGEILTVALSRPAPIGLLITAIFYLWIFIRRTRARSSQEVADFA